ncbi:MAG: acetyl-CoA carboxylase biotin carboxyl carrier protein [Verrucomicrobiaceae bacterium]|nr:acetyl-CoA carboxylase biotin carboxyl carrier protein [Verrucomicrobiaceae bacterium]
MPKRKPTAKKAAAAPKPAPKSGTSAAVASNFDLAHIREIVGLMADNDLSYFHIEQKDAKLEIRRGSDFAAAGDLLKHLPAAAPMTVAASPVPAPAAAAPAAPVAAPAAAPAASVAGPTINSPMVGTFYRSSAPGEKSFVNVGDQVDENTTVCIIEAMKVMNEIKAEARGTIARVLAEDGKPVQYGQPLFELKA